MLGGGHIRQRRRYKYHDAYETYLIVGLRLEPEMTFVDHQSKVRSGRALLDDTNNTGMETTGFVGYLDRV